MLRRALRGPTLEHRLPPHMRTHLAATEDFEVQLRSANLSCTRTRLAVLRHLVLRRRPVTHTEAVNALGSGFDRVSIYRALTDLTRARLLTRSDEGDHVWRFSLVRREHPDDWRLPRFVCIHCGVVTYLSEQAIRMNVRGQVPRSLRERRVEVQLRGECDGCFSS
jgi:Fur family ferric uptake transcriptional regulator